MEAVIRIHPSGNMVNILDMKSEQIHIEDIAHHLALCNRFNGATAFPYSVAAHSVYMADYLVSPENAFAALMHDATEAYIGDMVKPLKNAIDSFQCIEGNLWRVIAEKYGLPETLPEEVHEADKKALRLEQLYLQGVSYPETEALYNEFPEIYERPWQTNKQMFLQRFLDLRGK